MSRIAAILFDSLESRTLLSADVTQYRYDPLSTGNNTSEVVLSSTNVNPTNFGRQFITQLDGQVYTETLAVANMNITRGNSQGIHNVLYVATMHNSVFAVDAETGAILWQDSFLQLADPRVTTPLSPVATAGVIPFPEGTTTSSEQAGLDAGDVAPEEGIFGIPVIDSVNHILYAISYTQERRNDTTTTATPSATGTDWHFVERLWAINLADGSVAHAGTAPAGAPVPVSAGQTIADTVLNPTTGAFPPFSTFTGYEYFAGPTIKGSGDNGGSFPNDDGWITNPNDVISNASHSIFAGTTPTAQGYLALNAIIQPTRTGLSLVNGVIYFGMTSHGDNGPYYGALLGYDATTLQNVADLVTTPTFESYNIISGSSGSDPMQFNGQGAIWGGEQSIVTDGTYLYVTAGNGAFNWENSNFSATNVTTDMGNTVQLPIDGDYGNTILKIAIDPTANQNNLDINNLPTSYNAQGQNVNGYGLRVIDFFTPSDLLDLNKRDQDVGSVGVLLLPNNVTSTVPGHVGDPMLISGNKSGRVYLIDRNNMGGLNRSIFNADDVHYSNGALIFKAAGSPTLYTDPSPPPDPKLFDRVLGELTLSPPPTTGVLFSIPSFYMNGTTPTLLLAGKGTHLDAYSITAMQSTSSPPAVDVNPAPLNASTTTFSNRGSQSSISSNNGTNAIIWNVNALQSTTTDDILAYGITLGAPIFDSNTNPSADSLTGLVTHATAVKFTESTDFNGMVYVGTGANWGVGATQVAFAQGAIVGYGLRSTYLATDPTFFSAPTGLTGLYKSGTGNILTWTNHATLASHARVERSTNGTNWSVLDFVDNGVNTFVDPNVSAGQTFFYRVFSINGANVTAATNSAQVDAAPPTLVSALSRKTQGGAGDFDINLPLTGTPGIESRSGGPTKIILTFDRTISIVGTTVLTLSSGAGSLSATGTQLTITLSGTTDVQYLTVSITDLRDLTTNAGGNFSLLVGVLLGDVNANGHTNSNDFTIVGAASGVAVTAANFRDDVNGNGVINSNDFTITGANSGHDLPAIPAQGAPDIALSPAGPSSPFTLASLGISLIPASPDYPVITTTPALAPSAPSAPAVSATPVPAIDPLPPVPAPIPAPLSATPPKPLPTPSIKPVIAILPPPSKPATPAAPAVFISQKQPVIALPHSIATFLPVLIAPAAAHNIAPVFAPAASLATPSRAVPKPPAPTAIKISSVPAIHIQTTSANTITLSPLHVPTVTSADNTAHFDLEKPR